MVCVGGFPLYTNCSYPSKFPNGQKDGPLKLSNMSVARRQSFPLPRGLISLGNVMPQGTMVINYIVSRSQAVASQKIKRKEKEK